VLAEIGYALGRSVPVFLVKCGGPFPQGMVESKQHVERDGVARVLREGLAAAHREALNGDIPVQVARHPGERAKWIGRRAAELESGVDLRQSALLSSFAIPDAHPSYQRGPWDARDGGKRTEELRLDQYGERRELQRHAAERGARLILSPRPLRRGPDQTRARLLMLRSFLCDDASRRVAVALSPEPPGGNVTILGDRFLCESQSSGEAGFRFTLFTSHAPTILDAMRRFDAEFRSLDPDAEADPRGSRERAVQEIDRVLASLPTAGP
jgi:hypothetical protein